MNLSHNPNNNNPSNNQACAACKYRRRKCAPDCILAPYFPHDRQRQFLNAHKLFGVRNITKIIENLDPRDKDHAMRSIIYQSDMRATDPVGGCYRYIKQLEAQIAYREAELELVLQQLAVFRAQAHHHHRHSHEAISTDHLNWCNNPNNIAPPPPPPPHPSHYHQYQLPQQQEAYAMVQEHHSDNINGPLQDDVNTWAMQNSMSSLSLQHSKNGDHESGYVGDDQLYNDQKSSSSMFDIHCDERNEIGFEPEELVERSDEAILFKIENAEANCIQQVQVQDHDLKGLLGLGETIR